MKQYGFVNSAKFEATRTFLIRQARKAINLIGSILLNPHKLYKCAGFGKSFFEVGTDRKVDTIVHEFSHAVWTSEDTEYNARTAMKELNIIARNARINQNAQYRKEILSSSYAFENAVRAAQ